MGKTKILENWTFTRSMPAPFDTEVLRRGKKDSTEESCLSVHNRMTRGRRATLNSVTLRGMLLAADIINGKSKGAMGVETENGQICRYYMETVDSSGAADEIRIFIYDPKKGNWRAAVKKGEALSPYPRIGESGASGKEMFLLLAYGSMVQGPIHDQEFEDSFRTFVREKDKGFPDMDLAMECAFLCCDNLYRRLENRDSLGAAGIPFRNDEIAAGNVTVIPTVRLKNGRYAVTRTDYGTFQVLERKEAVKSSGTIGELKSGYNRKFPLDEREKDLVPALPENYQVPVEVTEIVEAVLHTPMRVFMSAGESGTGKTTNAKMVAQLLGMPYYFFTCGEGTDETDLVSTMIPNIGGKEARPEVELPTFEDMVMDPASALERVCGNYEEEISQEEVIERAVVPLKEFMLRNTYKSTLDNFVSMSGAQVQENTMDYPLTIVVPAFMTSELKWGFTAGFLLYLPFLLIDVIVSTTLMSMGMVMLPPAMISMPFKLLLFVTVDGWELLFSSIVAGYK